MKKIALVFIVLTGVIRVNAQTLYTWDGSTSTAWNDTSNWSPSGIPGSSDHIRLNNGSLGNMPVLDQNRSVTNITITAGTMDLGGDTLTVTGGTTLTGGTVNNGVLRFTNATTSINYMTFGAVVDITVSSSSALYYNTFNSAVKIKKTAGGHDVWINNTFNSTLKAINQSTGGGLYLTNNLNSYYNGDVTVGGNNIHFASGTGSSIFATGKRIYIDASGMVTLNLNNVIQSDTAAQNLSSSTGQFAITNSQFGGKVNISCALLNMSGTTFSKEFTYTKGNAYNENWNNNTYGGTITINHNTTSIAAIIYLTGNTNQTYNHDIILTGTGIGAIATTSGTAISTFAAGKRIIFGSGGYNKNLHLKNVIQTDTVTQHLPVNGTLTIENSQFSNPINASGIYLYLGGSTFGGTSTFHKTGGWHEAWNNNTFNGVTHIKNGANVNLFLTDNLNSSFNNNITVSNTGSGSINFSNGAGVSTLASGKTITVGSGGFATGSLNLNRLVQSGSTAQSITLTGSASLNSSNATFNGPWTISAPHVRLNGGNIFHNTLNVTKTAAGSNDWTGGNTYNGDVTVTNTTSSYINLSYVSGTGDTYNANATFTRTGSGDILLSGNGATVTFKGNVTLNNISSTQFTGSNLAVFSGTAAQTLSGSTAAAISFGKLTINKTSNNLTLAYPLNITTTLTLISGRILTTSTNVLNFADSATVSSASNTSYVQGPVKKTGNDAFTFPTGKAGHYRPIGIAAPTNVATVFTAEYKDTTQTFGSSADTSIANLSDCEYWALTRSGSSDNVNVTLSWDTTSCNAATPLNMRVAGWNGSTWTNYGNGARTGNSNIGTVTAATAPATYNGFALGNKHCTATATITPTGDVVSCNNLPVNISGPAGMKKYTWSNAATTQSATITTTGTYTLNVNDTLGCAASATKNVYVWGNTPVIGKTYDFSLFAGGNITVTADSGLYVIGNVCADSVPPNVYNDSAFTNTLLVDSIRKQAELISKFYACYSTTPVAGTSFATDSVAAGRYYFSGNLTLSDTLTLVGDSLSEFVITVEDSLSLNGVNLRLANNINPDNVTWNVKRKLKTENSSVFFGHIITDNAELRHPIDGLVQLTTITNISFLYSWQVLNIRLPLLNSCFFTTPPCERVKNGTFTNLFGTNLSGLISNPDYRHTPFTKNLICSWSSYKGTPQIIVQSGSNIGVKMWSYTSSGVTLYESIVTQKMSIEPSTVYYLSFNFRRGTETNELLDNLTVKWATGSNLISDAANLYNIDRIGVDEWRSYNACVTSPKIKANQLMFAPQEGSVNPSWIHLDDVSLIKNDLTISTPITEICSGASITLTASQSCWPVEFDSFTWQKYDATDDTWDIEGTPSSLNTIEVNEVGIYRVVGIIGDGCFVTSNEIEVTNCTRPFLDVYTTGCPGSTMQICIGPDMVGKEIHLTNIITNNCDNIITITEDIDCFECTLVSIYGIPTVKIIDPVTGLVYMNLSNIITINP